MSFSRRKFIAATAGLPLSRLATTSANQSAQPKIGDKRGDFDAWFGHGTEVGAYFSYPPLSAGRASYYVAYDEDWRAQSILGDFQQLGGGGITFVESEAGSSPYLRDDSFGVMEFSTKRLLGRGWLAVRVWQSPSLATDLNVTGIVTVLDRVIPEPTGPIDGALFGETMVAMELPEVHPVVPNGNKPGPHTSEDTWRNFYQGRVSPAQGGDVISDPDYTFTILNSRYFESTLSNVSWSHFSMADVTVNTAEAARIVSDHLPVSRLISTTWYHAGPNYGNGFRLHHFEAQDTGIHFLSVQEVLGDEQNGWVTGIHLCPMAG